MSSLFSQISSSSTLLKSARSLLSTPSLFYGNTISIHSNATPFRRSITYPSFNFKFCGISNHNLGPSSVLSRFGVIVRCYSAKKGSTRKRKPGPEPVMEDEKEAYFVVRKGDVVGIYKSLTDCQAQVGSSICDPPVSVYKGYSLPKETEEYLASRGLQNPLYTIKASDLNDDLFSTLAPCPFQEPGGTSSMEFPQKRPHDVLGAGSMGADGLYLASTDSSNKLQKTNHMSADNQTCILEFDGASKGNPGPAGAGAVLRTLSGSVICSIRQGLGTATNNVAEYRAIILGLKKAIEMGYTSIRAQGDSKLVCMQIQGLWKVKNQNMSDLHAEATKLKDKFSSFQISHVLRDLNSDADEQANLAVSLANGQVQENLANSCHFS